MVGGREKCTRESQPGELRHSTPIQARSSHLSLHPLQMPPEYTQGCVPWVAIVINNHTWLNTKWNCWGGGRTSKGWSIMRVGGP